jgi:hypothetical protein
MEQDRVLIIDLEQTALILFAWCLLRSLINTLFDYSQHQDSIEIIIEDYSHSSHTRLTEVSWNYRRIHTIPYALG